MASKRGLNSSSSKMFNGYAFAFTPYFAVRSAAILSATSLLELYVKAMFTPFCANFFATDLPMPFVAPVMTSVLPFISDISLILLFYIFSLLLLFFLYFLCLEAQVEVYIPEYLLNPRCTSQL